MNDHRNNTDDTEEPIRTVDGWAATLGFEFAQVQGWVSAARLTEQKYLREQQDAISQFRQALMFNAATLELVQYPTTERWEGPLPKDWTKTLYIKQSALRRWANAHRPDWLNLPALHAPAPRAVHHPDAAGRIASLACMPDTTALNVRDWIDNLTLELCQERGALDPRWPSLREQFADMFDFADKAQLLFVRDGGAKWPPAKPLPADWHDVLFIPKGALRTWVATNQPNLLEATILSAEPTSAPAGLDTGAQQQSAKVEKAPGTGNEVEREHLTREQLALAFGPLWTGRAPLGVYLVKADAKWLQDAIAVRGKRGSQRGHRWNPVTFAELLRDCKRIPESKLSQAFRDCDSLKPWRDAWGKACSAFHKFDG